MDTSNIYIKMCEKAIELQDLKPSEPFHQLRIDSDIYIDDANFWYCTITDKSNPLCWVYIKVWLPRQDQLQEIMGFDCEKMGAMYYLVKFGCKKNSYYCKFNSMEQLWLAFVMREKFSKQWNGADWEVTL